MKFGVTAMAIAGLFNFLVPISMAIDSNCDYYQEMQLGQQFFIYNKEYSQKFPPQTSCRWTAVSPVGTRIVMTCNDIEIAETQDCKGDRLAVSLSGQDDLSDAHNYCGTGTLSLVSDQNKLVTGLFSTIWSTGGKFLCSLTAVTDTRPTTTTPAPSYCDCGWKQALRITGGQETGVNEFPAMAGIVDFLVRVIRCGGTIMSTRYVLTAAHCMEERNRTNLGVIVGEHDVTTGTETQYTRLYTIERIIIHPEYVFTTLLNDLAIVRTTESIEFSLYVGPVCLPFRYTSDNFVGQQVTACGWGLLEDFGARATKLQKVELNVVTNRECAAAITDKPVTNGNICTFAQDKDACQSDSGGPLFWNNDAMRRLFLVGVISFGRGCGLDVPSVNTRVTSYLTWIVSQTSDAQYCIK